MTIYQTMIPIPSTVEPDDVPFEDPLIDAAYILSKCSGLSNVATIRAITEAIEILDYFRNGLHSTSPYSWEEDAHIDPTDVLETIEKLRRNSESVFERLNINPVIEDAWELWRASAMQARHDRTK
jgi:hypothetical protein